jgi:hypothetical protein
MVRSVGWRRAAARVTGNGLLLVGESLGMRADYLRPRLDLLRARLEPGKDLARGRAFERYRDSFELAGVPAGAP